MPVPRHDEIVSKLLTDPADMYVDDVGKCIIVFVGKMLVVRSARDGISAANVGRIYSVLLCAILGQDPESPFKISDLAAENA